MANTAARYRPKTFDELAGQEFVVSTLKNSLKNGQIAHAYLFSGPRGCGKTSAARILARSLNCTNTAGNNIAEEPCGTCANCIAISKGASMDVLEIDGASNNSVNDVRQIKEEVLFPPQAGKYKVYIIDEVHMLSGSAFNALLKTIEEPPPYIVFIFATTELHKVPATIKSRCQQFNFRLISIETIQALLKKICAENNIDAEEDALFWIARESTGSMRDAFTLFDQVVSFSAGKIREDLIRKKLGIIGLEKLNALAEACAENNAEASFALADELLASGISIEQFVIDLAGYYRGLLLLKNNITRESLLGYKPQQFSAKALETYDSIRLEQALDILLECYRNLRYGVAPRFELETAVSKLTWLTKWISPCELKEAVEQARAGIPQGGQNSLKQSLMRDIKPKPAETAPVRSGQTRPQQTEADSAPDTGETTSASYTSSRSLADEFKRMAASKSGAVPNEDEDDDEPVWKIKKEQNKEMSPVEKITSVIPGVVIN